MEPTVTVNYDSGATPTYIAQCSECGCLIGCAVANVAEPDSVRHALKYRGQWERGGYKVSTVTAQDVRTWPRETAFTHVAGCSKDRRKKAQRVGANRDVQEATPLLSGLSQTGKP